MQIAAHQEMAAAKRGKFRAARQSARPDSPDGGDRAGTGRPDYSVYKPSTVTCGNM